MWKLRKEIKMSSSISETATKLLALLEPLSAGDRRRVVDGVLVLLGETNQPTVGAAPSLHRAGAVASGGTGGNAKEFFDAKEPNSKIEELAVAARFRELTGGAESHSKADFETVFKNARRNFDAVHFTRDLDNARTKGLFNKGSGKDAAVLAYYGQNYVDALPNREALKQVRAPKGSGLRKSSKKVAGATKSGQRTKHVSSAEN
jgi:hypothetical protein